MADTELIDLSATTTPALTDILYIVTDPAGTPGDRKVTLANLLATRAPLADPTGTGVATWPTLAASGAGTHLDPARLRGLLDHAGPPVAGDMTSGGAVGDIIVDTNGRMWSCTVADDPGTWIDLSSGRELTDGYAQITSVFSGTSTTEADVTGLTITPTGVGARPIKIIFDAQCVRNNTAGTTNTLVLNADGTDIAFIQYGGANYTAATKFPVHREVRIAAPVAGTVYKVSYATTAGTLAIDAAATSPAFIQAIEC